MSHSGSDTGTPPFCKVVSSKVARVKGRHSGVRVWLPGCGCGPVWGSGRWFWTGVSWLRYRWPGACLWMTGNSRRVRIRPQTLTANLTTSFLIQIKGIIHPNIIHFSTVPEFHTGKKIPPNADTIRTHGGQVRIQNNRR